MTAALVPLDAARTAPVRVHPAPALDPPYDAEPDRPLRGQQQRAVGEAEVLQLPRTRVTHLDEWRDRRQPAPVREVAVSGDGQPRAARQDGEQAVREFTRLLQEVLAGRHAAGRLRSWAHGRGWTHLDWLASYVMVLRRHGVTRARLLQLRMSWPTDTAVEAVAVLEYAGRVRAVPMRFELRNGRWCCVFLAILSPETRPRD